MTTTDFDIIVIGAGLVGTSFVLAMQNQGLRIAILETHLPHFPDDNALMDSRPLSLTYGSQQILNALGIWSQLQSYSCPINEVHVSEAKRFGGIYFRAIEENVPALGYVIPMGQLHQLLYQQIAMQNGVSFISIKELQGIANDEQGAIVTVKVEQESRQLRAQLVVAADGTDSRSRQLLGIKVDQKNYHEMAMTPRLALQHPHQHRAYERFTSVGIFAVLPLFAEQQCRVVWTMSNAVYQEINQLQDQELEQRLQQYLTHYLGPLQLIERGQSFPLQTVIAKETVRPHCVLLGNAAHTFYPIAAQGFNLSLRECALLSELLINKKKNGQNLGDAKLLATFARRRCIDDSLTQAITTGIGYFFNLKLPLLGKLRGLSLLMIDLFPPLKRQLARQLMGLGLGL